MSNNKQSSVEWLISQVEMIANKRVSKKEAICLYNNAIKEAKEIHKEEIRMAYMDGAFEKMRHFDGKEFMMPTDYYNETFGGNK